MLTTIKHKHTIIITLFMVLAFQACQKTPIEVTVIKEYPGVHPELWIHFQNFEAAAAKRGVLIDLAERGITGTIEDINIDNVVGACSHNTVAPNHVILDETFWGRSASLRRELIVFHELGHCYMQLDHRDGVYNDGRCKSIMRSGMGGCVDIYTRDSRSEYLDELFY